MKSKCRSPKVVLQGYMYLLCSSIILLCFAFPATAQDCDVALRQLAQRGVAPQSGHRLPPSTGSDVCGGGPCCLPNMTESLVRNGRDYLNNIVQRETLAMLKIIVGARNAFQESFEQALSSSGHECLSSFQQLYPRFADHLTQPLVELFAALKSSLVSTNELSISKPLSRFWNDLFPHIYHSSVHPHLAPLSPAYVDCLKKVAPSISPWKVIPNLVQDEMIKGIETVQLMYNILSVSHDVIINSRFFEVPEECGPPAARLRFCSLCHGTNVKPCHEFCLNVARGCLAPLVELDGAWNELGTAATRVEEAIRNSGLVQLLRELPDRFSDAILIAMESGSKLQKTVRKQCGQHTHESSKGWEEKPRSPRPANGNDSMSRVSDVGRTGSILELRASESAAVLSGSRHFWVRLSDGPCSHLSSDRSDCWNGYRVASYSRSSAGLGLAAQKYNPEVQVKKPSDTGIYALAEQLRAVKRLVTQKLRWMPESESYRRYDEFEGSGSRLAPETTRRRRPSSNHVDDEDDGEGSGDVRQNEKNGQPDKFSPGNEAPPIEPPKTAGASSSQPAILPLLLFTPFTILNFN